MQLLPWNDCYQSGVIDLWNRTAIREGYKELTEDSFNRIFRQNTYFDPACTFILAESDSDSDSKCQSESNSKSKSNSDSESAGNSLPGTETVRGFACGCTGDDLPLGAIAGYLTCIVLDEEIRTDEHYATLLDDIEARFRILGKKQADVLFFNPMRLPWYIPDTSGHEHNNAPGVPAGSALHSFLLSRGYAERARECGMHLPLADFRMSDDILKKEEQVAEAGYTVELYDPKRHSQLEEMLTKLGNAAWESEISRCAAEGIPFLVAAQNGQAAGFAGPVIREPNGRGYFTGIGVDPEHEGRGLGTLLFHKLCEAFQQIGANYMSLFTGSQNPALRIYEKAGFRTVRQFAIMRRELNPNE
ncbi:GNAT family N-acetyltransferase [Gorillibacterium timonense]|uniref:GNAT family N-acetyltransferase n=1 Tax=Gorillibacterium timonense TaxID=1689269 RepID=UPI00071C8506|nr:GNAT family N-acetyltransferase [Gorillibacterium timonense]